MPEESQARCVDSGGGGTATEDLVLFDRVDQDPYKSYIGSPYNWGGTELGSDPSAVIDHPGFVTARTSDVNVQQDARKITWTSIGQFYLQSPEADLRPYLNANSALEFDTIVSQASQGCS